MYKENNHYSNSKRYNEHTFSSITTNLSLHYIYLTVPAYMHNVQNSLKFYVSERSVKKDVDKARNEEGKVCWIHTFMLPFEGNVHKIIFFYPVTFKGQEYLPNMKIKIHNPTYQLIEYLRLCTCDSIMVWHGKDVCLDKYTVSTVEATISIRQKGMANIALWHMLYPILYVAKLKGKPFDFTRIMPECVTRYQGNCSKSTVRYGRIYPDRFNNKAVRLESIAKRPWLKRLGVNKVTDLYSLEASELFQYHEFLELNTEKVINFCSDKYFVDGAEKELVTNDIQYGLSYKGLQHIMWILTSNGINNPKRFCTKSPFHKIFHKRIKGRTFLNAPISACKDTDINYNPTKRVLAA